MTSSSASNPLVSVKVAALIPAYREAAHIGEVVRRVREQLDTVLVVDDGSPDETADRARQAGAEVIVHSQNAGKEPPLRPASGC